MLWLYLTKHQKGNIQFQVLWGSWVTRIFVHLDSNNRVCEDMFLCINAHYYKIGELHRHPFHFQMVLFFLQFVAVNGAHISGTIIGKHLSITRHTHDEPWRTKDQIKGSILLMEEILHQLRLVVYPIIYWVLAPSQVVGLGISEPSTLRIISLPQ